jgi:hypothetical protein
MARMKLCRCVNPDRSALPVLIRSRSASTT